MQLHHLLVFGSANVRSVSVGAGARDVAQFTAQLCLDATGAIGHLTAALLSRLFLLVLLPFQMFPISLWTGAADLADIAVVQLRLLRWTFRLLYLVLVESRLPV